MEEFIYDIMDWIVGDHDNPIAWESILKELGMIYILFGLVAGIVYHFTNTRNLNSKRQNTYFLKVGGLLLLLLWVYSAIRLFRSIGEYVGVFNYLRLCLGAAFFLFFIPYLISFYVVRAFSNTKKKYFPTLLTGFLKPKKQK